MTINIKNSVLYTNSIPNRNRFNEIELYKLLEFDSLRAGIYEIMDRMDFPSIKHYVWEEDGRIYSAWKIKTGTITINTGNGGMELIRKAFQEEGKKLKINLDSA